MRSYLTPEVSILKLRVEDILTLSNGKNGEEKDGVNFYLPDFLS